MLGECFSLIVCSLMLSAHTLNVCILNAAFIVPQHSTCAPPCPFLQVLQQRQESHVKAAWHAAQVLKHSPAPFTIVYVFCSSPLAAYRSSDLVHVMIVWTNRKQACTAAETLPEQCEGP